jgi:UDP-glucose 4-epimerase
MKILVVGSEGFIGSNAVKYFLQQGHDVYGADILLKKHENYTLLFPEIPDFSEILKTQPFDICINASGGANVNFSITNPKWDYNLNVQNVFYLLEAIRKTNINCKFIQLSSAALYGNPNLLPINEEANIKPLSPYGFHKWQSELLCKEFYEVYKVPSVILRIFSAYGPCLKKQIFWDIYQKTKSGNEINLFGTGEESRDFIFIDDLLQSIECIIKNGKFQSEIYNVGNGKEILIHSAVTTFLSLLEWRGNVCFSGEKRTGDPINWKADISKISSLGYRQKIIFEEGIKLYCKWLKKQESE